MQPPSLRFRSWLGGLGVAAEELFRSPQALVCSPQREESALFAEGNFEEPELAHGAASQDCSGKLTEKSEGDKGSIWSPFFFFFFFFFFFLDFIRSFRVPCGFDLHNEVLTS